MTKKSTKKVRVQLQRYRWWVIGLVGTLGILGLGGWVYNQQPPIHLDGRIQIVAAENFWGDIASQIGGPEVEVTSFILDPGIDPHLYESSAKNAAALASAELVIKNGLGYDEFMDKLLSVSNISGNQVITASEAAKISDLNNANPHIWYSPTLVIKVATVIKDRLSALDPTHTSAYQQRLDQFVASLEPLQSIITTIKTMHPDTLVLSTERVAGYLLASSQLISKQPTSFSQAIEDGVEPNPTDNLTMEHLLTSHQIKAFIYNIQATSPITQHLDDLATKSGIPVVSVTETMPATAINFQDWQISQAKALLAALGSQASY